MEKPIALILLLAALLIAGCVSNRAPAPTPTPVLTANPTPTLTIEPTVVPTIEPTLAPTEAPTIAPTPNANDYSEIDNIASGMQAAANAVLSKRNATKSLALAKLQYEVGGSVKQTRNYYQGDTTTSATENGQLVSIFLTMTVRGVYAGEDVYPAFSPSMTKTVAGRQMRAISNPDSFKVSITCFGGKYYVYAEKRGYGNFEPDELFTEMAQACPA